MGKKGYMRGDRTDGRYVGINLFGVASPFHFL